jgi:hypothetical protein
MVNKRGWLRIVEASVAILIVFGVLLALSNTKQPAPERSLETFLPPLLEEIAVNATLRGEIVQYDTTSGPTTFPNSVTINDVAGFLSQRINRSSIKYNFSICDPSVVCSLTPYPATVNGGMYTYERIISSNLSTGYNPKKLKLFMWR